MFSSKNSWSQTQVTPSLFEDLCYSPSAQLLPSTRKCHCSTPSVKFVENWLDFCEGTVVWFCLKWKTVFSLGLDNKGQKKMLPSDELSIELEFQQCHRFVTMLQQDKMFGIGLVHLGKTSSSLWADWWKCRLHHSATMCVDHRKRIKASFLLVG